MSQVLGDIETAPSRVVLEKRRFLFLQGLMGPIFERIGKALSEDGHAVYRINFNGGDRVFWSLSGGTDYLGTLEDWPRFLDIYLRAHGISDVVLFGDCRPLHHAALEVCRREDVRVHVFEEGYLRPDWVTLEPDGVNGHSSLPRDPEYYRRVAATLGPMPEHRGIPSSFRMRALQGIVYNAADVLTRWRFRHWCDYRPWSPLAEGTGWLRRLAHRQRRLEESERTIGRIARSRCPYVLFPLQLDADAQIRLHSGFSGIADAIERIVSSFAADAPDDLLLVIKEHPLDNGMTDWREVVARVGREQGVLGRIAYVPYGEIGGLVRGARGVVTINSTTGTLALADGIPVLCLGQSVYDMPGITHQDGLAAFWRRPLAPDAATFAAFRRVLVEYCLVAGGFFSEEGLQTLVAGVRGRLSGVDERILPDPRTVLEQEPGAQDSARADRDDDTGDR